MTAQLQAIYVGKTRALPGDGRPSAFLKAPVDKPVYLSRNGLEGDSQADRKEHGGPDRALNQYPSEHYPGWVSRFPNAAKRMLPGSFGENLSSLGMIEETVCIGDIYGIGSAVVQVAQPRMPCWKLAHVQGLSDLPKAMVDSGRSGWLCRVLEEGVITAGDSVELLEAHPLGLTISGIWAGFRQRSHDMDQLDTLANLPELAESWRGRFRKRLNALRAS